MLLWAVVTQIALNILVAIPSPKSAHTNDLPTGDPIHRFGTRTSQSFLVIGAGAGVVLAMARADQFRIAHAIILALALSAILSSTAKPLLVHQGRGFQIAPVLAVPLDELPQYPKPTNPRNEEGTK
ncbi:hypothetical protein [Streptomyces sp. NPDC001816]|uniref:hypothetical protein n=1 Tax=Streptomyces sp. NPDC001816 TaxID=3364612 RepID=UPI0036848459